MISPLMLSSRDDELLGAAIRSDAMGVLAIWSVRARDLVPHLTEQTTDIRGFQILVEGFRAWKIYQRTHPERTDHCFDEFFLLFEQAFARTICSRNDGDWSLPGARRVRARAARAPQVFAELCHAGEIIRIRRVVGSRWS